mgnify:CR=1 FL=1
MNCYNANIHCFLVVGRQGISVNSKRNLAALVSIEKKTCYHLFDIGNLRIIQKARWDPKHLGMCLSHGVHYE